MPIRLDTEREYLPTLIVKPDMRFANTFLDTKYRDYSVPGEALMDKISGELFMKRPIDGRVISFFQNKKMLHDLTLELRVMLTNNENIHYPYDNENAFFVSSNYDLLTINNEQPINILNDNIIIQRKGENIDNINTLSFNISKDNNGFFCRPTTRDCDKPFIEFLVNKYNTFFKNYSGDNEEYLEELDKFDTIELWEDSSCEIVYSATKYKNGVAGESITSIRHPVRVNENSGVEIPYTFIGERESRNYDYIKIEISSIEFYKVHYMIEHKDDFGEDFLNNYNKLLFEKDSDDNGIVKPAEFSVMYFIDDINQIELLGNEFLLALLDVPYVNRYMTKMSKLKAASQFLTTIEEPNEIEWGANTCWAERVRDVYKYGVSERTTSENSFENIAKYFSINSATISGFIITEDELNEEPDAHDNDFLLIDEG